MRLRLISLAALLLLSAAGVSRSEDAPAAMPHMSGWFERAVGQLEAEASSDVAMAPDVWSALNHEWRSFDREGSAVGVIADIGWIAVVVIAALAAERFAADLLSRRPRRRMRVRGDEPHLVDLLGLVACDLFGLTVFYAVFVVAERYFLPAVGVTALLALFSANILIRWRATAVISRAILRPRDRDARLIDISDAEARRIGRFLSASIFAIIVLVGFGRYGLMDEEGGAPHVIGLINAVLVCGIYFLILIRTRVAAEALIRGRRSVGLIASLRVGLAQAWMALAVTLVAGLFVFFVAGLSLGLLTYYHAVVSTLGVLFVMLVLDRLIERVWLDSEGPGAGARQREARTLQRILQVIGFAAAAMILAWLWIHTIEPVESAASAAMRSATAAIGTLFAAFLAWELVRLAIDRNLQGAGAGPGFPGVDDDDAATPASRLQTVLPLLRAAFAVVIGVLAALIVLSRLGVDTAPLIAGAGVFGLAVSFGSQSLVRDVISGLFYMWDDAFRVGEYIDTGRLKGTVETLGIRSVKLRHQNGPLHTIPYGQLGAVTNLSRDYSTIKFNLRFVPRTDIELVRKTVKQIGIAMQDDPEMAAEIMQPLKLQGIAEVVDNALVLRFKFTTRPVKPSWVQREYLKRMYKAFDEKGITFASGAVFIQSVPVPDAEPPDSAPAAPLPAGGTGSVAAAALGTAAGVTAALEVAELAEPARSGG
jgi:moderate conductance mechanosensitive channel